MSDYNYWIEKNILPYNFYRGSAVIYDNKIYILGGSYDSVNYTKHYSWDGTSWMEESTLPYNFYQGCVVVYDDEIHIIGGYGGPTKHYSWDGTSWTEESTLPYNFYQGSAVVYDGKIHILGGSGNKTKHCSWDGISWTEENTLPYSFYYGSAVIYDGKIHILGSNTSGNYTKHYSWDGTEWTEESTLPYSFYRGSAVVYDNKIHILGSYSSNSKTKHYSWDGTEWTEESTLPYGFYDGCAVVYDNRICILGGYNSLRKYCDYGERIYSKIVYGDKIIMDLTSDTVKEELLVSGIKAHDNKGEVITGTRPKYYKKNSSKYALICKQELKTTPSTTSGEVVDQDAFLLGGQIVKLRTTGGSTTVQLVSIKTDGVTESVITLLTATSGYLDKCYIRRVRYITDRWVFVEHYNYTTDVSHTLYGFRSVLMKSDGSLMISAAWNWGVATTATLDGDAWMLPCIQRYPGLYMIMDYYLNSSTDKARFRGYRAYLTATTGVLAYNSTIVCGNASTYYANTTIPDRDVAPWAGGIFYKFNNTEYLISYMDYNGSARVITMANIGADMQEVGITNHHMIGMLRNGLIVTVKNNKLYLWSYDNTSTTNLYTKVSELRLPYIVYKDASRFNNLYRTSKNTVFKYGTSASTNGGFYLKYLNSNNVLVTYMTSASVYGNRYITYFDPSTGEWFTATSSYTYLGHTISEELYYLSSYTESASGGATRYYYYYAFFCDTHAYLLTFRFEYIPSSNIVTKLANISLISGEGMPYDAEYGYVVRTDTLKFEIFGGNGNNSKKHYSLELAVSGSAMQRTYTIVNTTEKSTLPYEFRLGRAIIFNNKIHILGSDLYGNERKHYSFDGTSWTEESILPYKFFAGSVKNINGTLYLIGGGANEYDRNKIYKFIDNDKEWIRASTFLPYNFFNDFAKSSSTNMECIFASEGKRVTIYPSDCKVFSFTNDVLLLSNGMRFQVTPTELIELEPVDLVYAQCPTDRSYLGPESDPYEGVFIYGDD